MSSFNRDDYKALFEIGAELYRNNSNRTLVRENAVRIMSMVESIAGQQAGWPNIAKRYRHLTTYETGKVVKFPKRPISKSL